MKKLVLTSAFMALLAAPAHAVDWGIDTYDTYDPGFYDDTTSELYDTNDDWFYDSYTYNDLQAEEAFDGDYDWEADTDFFVGEEIQD